jgi:hypothetical protein
MFEWALQVRHAGRDPQARLRVTSGAAEQADDDEPFAEKMALLAVQWREQRAEAAWLDAAIVACPS